MANYTRKTRDGKPAPRTAAGAGAAAYHAAGRGLDREERADLAATTTRAAWDETMPPARPAATPQPDRLAPAALRRAAAALAADPNDDDGRPEPSPWPDPADWDNDPRYLRYLEHELAEERHRCRCLAAEVRELRTLLHAAETDMHHNYHAALADTLPGGR